MFGAAFSITLLVRTVGPLLHSSQSRSQEFSRRLASCSLKLRNGDRGNEWTLFVENTHAGQWHRRIEHLFDLVHIGVRFRITGDHHSIDSLRRQIDEIREIEEYRKHAGDRL